jgi:hypothetical protein
MAGSFKLHGFKKPNCTLVPDEFFDVVAPNLTEGELRVLLYIIRRTFGFKKDSDAISLRQMVEGIRTKDGRVLDQGTGLSKPSVVRAVKGLIEKEIIVATRRSSVEKGDEPTTYSLLFQDDTVLSKATRGGKLSSHGGVAKSNTQETVKQETVKQQHPQTPSESHTTNSPASPPSHDVVVSAALLKARGIHPRRAATLARNYPAARIQDKVDLFDYLTRLKSPLIAKNPAGWLCKAIEEDYYPPKHYLENKHKEIQRQQREEEQRRTKAQELQRRAKELARDPGKRAEAWLEAWEQGRKVLGKPPLSREERRERLLALTERFRQEAAQFFEEHPDFYPQEGSDDQPRQRAPTPGAYAGAGG